MKSVTTLLDTIETMNQTAQIPAYRALSNSSLGKLVSALRVHQRMSANAALNEENKDQSLDVRNEQDQDHNDEIKAHMGFVVEQTPYERAKALAAWYTFTSGISETMAQTRWDKPMTPEQMIDFMIEKSNPLDEEFLNQLAKASGIDEKSLRTFHELSERQERELLTNQKPAIMNDVDTLIGNDSEAAMEQLSILDTHQLGVKVHEGLVKAKNNVLMRAMRTRSIADLGSIPLIDEAKTQIERWVDAFENTYSQEIQEAMEAGRTVNTIAK